MRRMESLRWVRLVVAGVLGLACGAFAQTFEATWESLGQYRCPDWFRDAKLGIFLHWGPSSVPAVDDWYGRNMYVQGHRAYEYHVRTFGHPSQFGFKDIIPLWRAEKWDPDRLVKLFKQAGARYIVPVAAFHDNFDLWNSVHHRWNAVNMGPKKDIVGLWRRAALENGLRFGASLHHDRVPSWFSTSKGSDATGPLAGVPYDGNDPRFVDLYLEKGDEPGPYLPKNASEAWKQTWFLRTKDLIDQYRPDLLYFDGGVAFGEVGLRIMAYYYNESQRWHGGRLEAVLNQKKSLNFRSGEFRAGTSVRDLERSKLEEIGDEPWQTDTSIGPWFCRPDARYESPNAIIDMFVDIVAKNGNLLLNIPLQADGTLDAEAERILSEMAAWIRVNGEAIYGTRPWTVHGEGPTMVKEGYSEEIKEAFTAGDFRFTTGAKALYAIGLDWPGGGAAIRVKSLSKGHGPEDIAEVRLLGHDGPLTWTRDDDALEVVLPETKPCEHAYALKISSAEGTGPTRRFGLVVGLKPERIRDYRALHADSNPGVRDLLRKYHLHNFSIFLQQLGGRWFEFGYFEYDGDDYDADMAALAAEPRNIEWLKVCDPMQIPLPGSAGWTEMERIFYNK